MLKNGSWVVLLGKKRVYVFVCIKYNININALYIIIFKRSKVGKLVKTIWEVVS